MMSYEMWERKEEEENETVSFFPRLPTKKILDGMCLWSYGRHPLLKEFENVIITTLKLYECKTERHAKETAKS